MTMAAQAHRLVELAAAGDEQAFAELVRASDRTLYAAARAILGSDQDAQDCVQEAILKGWQKLDTLRDLSLFRTWLTRIAITTAINMARKKKRGAPLLVDVPAKGERISERMDVRRAVEALDRKARVCAVLYYFEDMSVDEISRALGVRTGTVKSRLFRARGKLRSALEGYENDDET
jgi:RNA polymerase sigma-70 factor (ECF subfamily)